MDLNPVILAIPIYFILMGLEIIYEKYTLQNSYRLNDAITNISTGTLQQLTNTFIVLFKIGIYTIVYEKFALTELPQNVLTFIAALIFWDFCYYWEHRMAHSVNLFWGGHVVHHQSEDFNLSVALRQTSTGFIWGFPFYLPMALFGFHPLQFVLVGGINLLYQFWIHTEHINKLPLGLEYIFNSPSHHRVHHGRDPKYIDKNFGGILIIWDRLFNSFKEEEERPNYGITTPLNSWNPVYANFRHYIYLTTKLTKVKSIPDGFRLLFKKPGWQPAYLGDMQQPCTPPSDYKKYDRKLKPVQWYILTQFLIAAMYNAYFFFNVENLSTEHKWVFTIFIVASTLLFGWMFEKFNFWIISMEIFRQFITIIIIALILSPALNIPWVAWLFTGIAIMSCGWILKIAYLRPKVSAVE